jgi:hypothetical protein
MRKLLIFFESKSERNSIKDIVPLKKRIEEIEKSTKLNVNSTRKLEEYERNLQKLNHLKQYPKGFEKLMLEKKKSLLNELNKLKKETTTSNNKSNNTSNTTSISTSISTFNSTSNNSSNIGVELKKINPLNEKQKNKNFFNMFLNYNQENMFFIPYNINFPGNPYKKNMFIYKNTNMINIFKEHLVKKINSLDKNSKIYKIIKSYNKNKGLTEDEKNLIKLYILSEYHKLYPKEKLNRPINSNNA